MVCFFFQVCSLQSLPFYGVLPYSIFISGFFNSLGEIGWATLILHEQLGENRDLMNNNLCRNGSGGFRGF